MKLLLVTVCIALVYADVSHIKEQTGDKSAKIISQELDMDVDGKYRYAFDTENGISAQETGELKNPTSEDAAQEVQGQFQYTAPDGTVIQQQYIANENGFQPEGAHLPTPPPIPPAILRALEWIAAHPPKDDIRIVT